jgi:uncharacterized membrane protein YfcA
MAVTGLLAVLTGLVVGTLSGLVGIGGGVVLVPVLVIGFGFSQHAAQGTSLATLVPTALVGVATHYRHGNVAIRPGVIMGLVGMAGVAVAALAAQHVSGPVLERVFGAFLLVSAYRLFRGGRPSAASPSGSARNRS